MAEAKVIRARINASGHRLIGEVELGPDQHRISDVLNGAARFVLVRDAEARHAVLTDAVSYVIAIEEPRRPGGLRRQGEFHAVTVELREPRATLHAECFVPDGGTLIEVLDGPDRFLNLRNVEFVGSRERYDHLAVRKGQMTVVRTGE